LHSPQLSGHVDGFIEIDKQPAVQMAKEVEVEEGEER
jgi:hypothetical protein